MRHNNQIIHKRRPFNSNEFRTSPKIKRSRRAQKIQPGHLLFPSCLPNDKDNLDLQKLKKFKMKIDLIIKSIEGYLNIYKGTKPNNMIHVGKSNTKSALLDGDFSLTQHTLVNLWFEKLVQLRAFALKELHVFSENPINADEKIVSATGELVKFHEEIKKWDSKSGEILETQNLAVLAAKNLVLDFQPVDHAIDAKKFIRGLQEACDTQSGGDLEKAVKGKLKQLAREQFLDDKQEAENKDRGNLKDDLLVQYNKKVAPHLHKTQSNSSFGSNYGRRGGSSSQMRGRNRQYRPNRTRSDTDNFTYRNQGGDYHHSHGYSGSNRTFRVPNSNRDRVYSAPNFDNQQTPRRQNNKKNPEASKGRKRKYSDSAYNNKKRKMELIESKIAKYEKKIKLIQSKIEKFM